MPSRLAQHRKFVIATGVVAGLALLGACADSPTGTGAAPGVRATRTTGGKGGGSSTGDDRVTVFTVNTAKTQAFSLPGGHRISFPARSICDVASSSYGPTEWDRPCRTQSGSVTITARTWTDVSGHARVDFSPRMRFNPAGKPVELKMKDSFLSSADLGILYCADDAAECVDESLTDPSLVTYSESGGNAYSRRIKHFSGYNIAAGRSIQTSGL
jgi:hypothetical protein